MNGIILVDKSTDWTSMDVCAKLRGVLGERKIGHSGTLDPMATGLLTVFVGRATRAVEFAEADEKTYLATLRLGRVTDTQDIWGRTLGESEAGIDDEALLCALDKFRGDIEQVPPMYSAIKINGKKLYDIARKGGQVERKPRRVSIYELEYLGRSGPDVSLRVRCSKGTYIRTLCHDIGAALGCGGCMASLRRICAGSFSVEQAHTMAEIEEMATGGRAEELLLPTDSLFEGYEALRLDQRRERELKNGVRFPWEREGTYRLYSVTGEFLALGRAENGKMAVIKSFYEVV